MMDALRRESHDLEVESPTEISAEDLPIWSPTRLGDLYYIDEMIK